MGKTETRRISTMVPFLPAVPAGRQRLIASLYDLETHLDMIDWLVGLSPSDKSPGTLRGYPDRVNSKGALSVRIARTKTPAADRVIDRMSASGGDNRAVSRLPC